VYYAQPFDDSRPLKDAVALTSRTTGALDSNPCRAYLGKLKGAMKLLKFSIQERHYYAGTAAVIDRRWTLAAAQK